MVKDLNQSDPQLLQTIEGVPEVDSTISRENKNEKYTNQLVY